MTPRRLVLVSRRFWPLVGGAERMMAALAVEMATRGHEVRLLTARWESLWSAEMNYRGIPVVRIPQPGPRLWGTFQYMRGLRRWLRRHRTDYDLVYVSMLKHDAYTVLGTVGGWVPVVLRAEGSGPTGDCSWQHQVWYGWWIRRRCRMADGIIAPSRAIRNELVVAGYGSDRVHYIPNGVALPPLSHPARKVQARAALAAANPRLRLEDFSPLAVYTGRLDRVKGLDILLEAWRRVARDIPNARLWLVGEGPFRDALLSEIEHYGLSDRVVLVGVFDPVDEILAAADVFVFPSRQEGMSLALLEAMAAGLPIVASDISGNREILSPHCQEALVSGEDPEVWALAIRRVLTEPAWSAALGRAARRIVEQNYSLSQTVESHLALFETLLASKKR